MRSIYLSLCVISAFFLFSCKKQSTEPSIDKSQIEKILEKYPNITYSITPASATNLGQVVNSLQELETRIKQLSAFNITVKETLKENETVTQTQIKSDSHESIISTMVGGAYPWQSTANVIATDGEIVLTFKVYLFANFTYSLHPVHYSIKLINTVSDVESNGGSQASGASAGANGWRYEFSYEPIGSSYSLSLGNQMATLAYNGTATIKTIYTFAGYSIDASNSEPFSETKHVNSSTFPNLYPD